MKKGHIITRKSQTGTVKFRLDREGQGRILWTFVKNPIEKYYNSTWENANIFVKYFEETDWIIWR